MPKLVHQTPKYRHHKSTGQAVVTLNGRDLYLGKWRTAESKREYARLTSQWLEAGGVLPESTLDTLSVQELLNAFRLHAKTYYVDRDGKPSQEQINFCTLIRRLRLTYGRTAAAEFGPLKLQAFRQSLVDEGLSRSNIKRQITRVRHMFKWAAGNELIPASVVEALKCVAGLRSGKTAAKETEPVKPVPEPMVDAVVPHAAPQVATMIQLQCMTGMRSGEVCFMRTCDINTQGAVWTYTPARHKTQFRGHTRIVYLGPKAQDIIKPWLRTDLESYLFQPQEADHWRRQRRHKSRRTPLRYGNRLGTNRVRKPKRRARDHYTSGSYGREL